jgi:hypothetical protein
LGVKDTVWERILERTFRSGRCSFDRLLAEHCAESYASMMPSAATRCIPMRDTSDNTHTPARSAKERQCGKACLIGVIWKVGIRQGSRSSAPSPEGTRDVFQSRLKCLQTNALPSLVPSAYPAVSEALKPILARLPGSRGFESVFIASKMRQKDPTAPARKGITNPKSV